MERELLLFCETNMIFDVRIPTKKWNKNAADRVKKIMNIIRHDLIQCEQ